VLQRRLGPMPATLRQKLSQLDRTQVEALSEVMLDLSDMADLQKWLERTQWDIR